jgi:predicted phosphodiesterase
MTRILLVGDSHGNLNFMNHVLKIAQMRNADRVIQLGDFGVWPGPAGKEYLDGVEQACKALGIDLWVIPGNHDDWNQIEALESPWIRPRIRIMGKVNFFTEEGISFLCVGGAVSIDRQYRTPNKSWWSQEALTSDDVDLSLIHI